MLFECERQRFFGFAELREPDSGHYSRVRGQLDFRYQLQLMFVRIFFLLVRFNAVLGPSLQFLQLTTFLTQCNQIASILQEEIKRRSFL
jgi:hypothetical protein